MAKSTVASPERETAITVRKVQKYGWVPDLPDHRDLMYAAPITALQALPPHTDLTAKCPPVYDQGQLGSCTANGIAACFEYDLKKQGMSDFMPSRLFIYYNERLIEGTVDYDSGAQIRDGIKSIAKQGVCPESEWAYNIQRFTDKPPRSDYKDALKNRAVQYFRVPQTLTQMKGCLASGYPFVFGFTVYESFESPEVARTGIVPMPSAREKVIGGHCVVAVGYDDATQTFLVRNSWGPGWGIKGYFKMPYSYLLTDDLATDFWTVRLVT